MHADGTIAPLPIAVVEQQGYVVAAKRVWATALEEAFGDRAFASRLRNEADRLAALIDERFWWEEQATYYLGLDGDKRPIESVASNPGHLLWAGAVPRARAAAVAARLLAPDMWSGWGLRCLSASHPAFDPFAYQRGSVWPHDNGIVAAGCLAYGDVKRGSSIVRTLLDTAQHFEQSRLPEVFAGVTRQPGAFPARYLGACAPQAWSSGAVFHALGAVLGLRADAHRGRLAVAAEVPDWLDGVRVSGLTIGKARVDLSFAAGETRVDSTRGEVTVTCA